MQSFAKNLKIMYYTHDSLGIGHTIRTLAIIRGLRAINKKIRFLVITASKVPDVFLDENIEVVKIPSTILIKSKNGWTLKPRFLNIGISNLIGIRQKILLDCFYSFRPHALFIDNILTGQGGEFLSILIHRRLEKLTGQHSFLIYYISRGIIDKPENIRVERNRKAHLSSDINLLSIVDKILIMEDKKVVDFKKDYNFSAKTDKIKYLGKIISKGKNEFLVRKEVFEKYGLPLNKKIILVRLGHERDGFKLLKFIIQAFVKFNNMNSNQFLLFICLDPYTDKERAEFVVNSFRNKDVIGRTFVKDLIDLVHHSDLIISRAGYNICVEIVATNSKAILLPVTGRTGEQLMRAKKLQNKFIVSLNEDSVTPEKILRVMNKLIKIDRGNRKISIDRDKICRKIYNYLASDLKRYGIK